MSWVVAAAFLAGIVWDFTVSGWHGEHLWVSVGIYALAMLGSAWQGIKQCRRR